MKKSFRKNNVQHQSAEIVCVLDRSGSMKSIQNAVICYFNQFIDTQQKLPSEAFLTLMLFDDRYHFLYYATPIKEVLLLSDSIFVPRSTTALYDAIAYTIEVVRNHTKNKHVIMCILTDGRDNASREFTHEDVMKLIKKRKEKQHWEVLFLAANQDAVEVGNSLGISSGKSVNFATDEKGIKRSMAIVNYVCATKRGFTTEFSASKHYKTVNFDTLGDEFLSTELKTIQTTFCKN